ncbi:MAG: prepilin peptidase [Bacteroidota bacterium]
MDAWAIYVVLTLGAGACLWIAWQDFRDREISVLAFLTLGLAGLGFQVVLNQSSCWSDRLTNLGLIGLIIGLTYGYAKLRRKGAFFDHQLGWGDVVMFVCLGLWFPPLIFMAFFTLSTLITLFFALAYLQIRSAQKALSIPLAGAMALGFLCLLPFYVSWTNPYLWL